MRQFLSPCDVLRRLVGFDSVSSRPNRALIDWLCDYLEHCGARVELVAAPEAGKASLLATIGPAAPGGIVLSGHTDVVPVEGQDWASDPFVLTERDGRLYGRGTADMKGFVALAAALAPHFAALPLARPIHLALSYDEEVGCLGAAELVRRLCARDPRPEIAIIGEPTELRPVNGHKGCDLLRLEITGKAAHSSAPALGANAILHAADFVAFLRGLFDELAREGGADPAFEPPGATFNVGRIEGGEAVNIVAASCRLLWELRTAPGGDAAAILARVERFIDAELAPRLRRECPEGAARLERLASVPLLAPEQDGAAEALVRQLTGHNRAQTVAFGSEAGFYQAAGLSAVLCGPGSIAQAHQPDEFIPLEQLRAGEAFLRRLGEWAARPADGQFPPIRRRAERV